METFAKAHSSMLHELARTHGTPLYIYDMERIKRNFLSFKQAFSGRKSLICYALKANANLSILKLLAQLGSGADCVSIGEVRRALLAGIPAYKIIFSGVGKRDDEIEEALRENILFLNVESFEELKRIESIAKSLVDSALGEQCGSVGVFAEGTNAKFANLPQKRQSSHSPTATPRILEESQAECETSCREQTALESTFPQNAQKSKKVDSRNEAQNVFCSQVDRRQDLGDRIVALQGDSRAHTWAYVTAESPQQSAILAPKPTPKPNQAQKARISIRVNPNIDAKTHPYISTGLHENKFGVDIDTAKQMYLYAHKSSMLEPVGIHFHIGSQLTELSPLIEASHKIAQLARSLVALGINLRFFDIGGGLGIRYEDEKPIDLYAYAQGILSTLSGCDWTIICEPGRRIVGDSGLLLTRVISQKSTESKRFVIVDAGMNDLMRPALYGAFHQPILLCENGAESSTTNPPMPADIVGPVCESSDTFCKNIALPPLHNGTLLGFENAGAYGHSMSSTYNARLRPAEVGIYTDENGAHAKLLRRAESFAESVQNELEALESNYPKTLESH